MSVQYSIESSDIEFFKKYFLKSTQYKKPAPNALRFLYQNLISCKTQERQNKNYQNPKSIGEKLKSKGLMLFVSFFLVLQDFKFYMDANDDFDFDFEQTNQFELFLQAK